MSAMRDLSGKNYKDYSYCLTGKLDLNLSVRMYGLITINTLSKRSSSAVPYTTLD